MKANEDFERVTFAAKKPMVEALRYYAKSQYRSVSSVIRQALADHLAKGPQQGSDNAQAAR